MAETKTKLTAEDQNTATQRAIDELPTEGGAVRIPPKVTLRDARAIICNALDAFDALHARVLRQVVEHAARQAFEQAAEAVRAACHCDKGYSPAGFECEYCGRPMAAIRALAKEKPKAEEQADG